MTDEIPPRYLVQCYHQLFVVPTLERVFVAALIGGRGRCLFKVERAGNEHLIDGIYRKLRLFWYEHVMKEVPPVEGPMSMEALRIMPREEGKRIALEDESLLASYLYAQEQEKHWKNEADSCKRALIQSMGDAEIAESEDGHQIVYKSHMRRSVDTSAMRLRHPGIVGEFETQRASYRLTVKKPKSSTNQTKESEDE